jgi:hypothetical protein
MPDPIENLPAEPAAPAADTPVPSEAERMEAVFETATAEADAQEPAPPAGDGDEPPAAEEPVDAAAEPPVAAEPEQPAAPATPEEQDEADAKALGFKNQRANAEFKRMRAELRELAPLREKLPELEARAGQWSELHGYLTQNKITPERFKQGMTMTAALSSDDPAILAQAREGLQWELRELNKRLGIAGDGYDPLAEQSNADLAEAVRNEEMTPERAQAIARERKEAAHYRAQHQQTQQQAQEAAQRQQAVQVAAQELDAIQAEYEKLDPRFQEKANILVHTLKPVFAKIPPSEWASTFRAAYTNLQLPAAAAPAAPSRPAPLRNQPLRASALPAGGAAAPASTPDDIIRKALEQAAAMDGVPFRG